MLALFFETYGAVCFFSLIGFLIWAAAAKLRPDLDEEDFEELEKLRKLANTEPCDYPLPDKDPIEDPIVELLSRPAPVRPSKRTKRRVRGRPHLFHIRKPHMT